MDRPVPTVVHLLNSLDGGGTERVLVSLCRRFDPRALRHVVVTLREPGDSATELPDHVACIPIGAEGRSRTAALKLARILRRCAPGIVHARNTGCWFDAAIAASLTPGAGLVLGFHGFDTGVGFTRRQRLITRIGSTLGARFTSVSHAGRRALHAQAGVALDRIDVLHNGVDLDRFPLDGEKTCRDETRRRLGCDDAEVVIGAVGSLTPVKRHDLLVRAFARAARCVPGLRLVIAGKGPMHRDLDAIATACGVADRVRLAGHTEDVPELLAGVDVFACASDYEGVSNAVLEALATGLPVVTTDVGDHGMIVRHGVDGLLVPPGREDAMAEALIELCRDGDLRARFATAARLRAPAFNLASTAAAYERYYRACTASVRPFRSARRDRSAAASFPLAAEGA